MWIEPQVLEQDLERLLRFLRQKPRECPSAISILEKRLDEVREHRRERDKKKNVG